MEKNLNNVSDSADLSSLQSNWWAFALRGILSLLFGGMAIYMPLTTMVTMTIIFGAYSIVDGIFSLVSGINRLSKKQRWGTLVLNGLIGVVSGLVALIMPQITSIGITIFLWTMISIWSITTGLVEIRAAVRLRQEIQNEWLLGLNGVLSVVLGIIILVLLWVNPLISVLTLGLLIGSNFVASGIVLLLLAFKLRNRKKDLSITRRIEQF
ncbi:HdeD family acid-resistance protein [Candidatus Odyssella acanthamoebae]|uniref:HdeD family acid-resistance protein n=1 Tax=Candidatus Odyssella acanthamoebae TaxID=91604 RepID=UPI00068B0ED8|nr:HdeD family acid-resistance protein [Candidatus Paracaedibacter acanthamoebae]